MPLNTRLSRVTFLKYYYNIIYYRILSDNKVKSNTSTVQVLAMLACVSVSVSYVSLLVLAVSYDSVSYVSWL